MKSLNIHNKKTFRSLALMLLYFIAGCIMMIPAVFLTGFFLMECSKWNWLGMMMLKLPAERFWLFITLSLASNLFTIVFLFHMVVKESRRDRTARYNRKVYVFQPLKRII